ncbi:MAG: hypothetical protein V4751_02545 [Pseudomonadota bacterium]
MLQDLIPDVRDGLTRKERAVLYCLRETQNELNGRNVPTLMLYGRVVEKVDMSQAEFQAILTRMVGLHGTSPSSKGK